MGRAISKDEVEPPQGYPNGPPVSDPFPIELVSASRFYNFVQQAATWNDYFVIIDQRSLKEYKKGHCARAFPKKSPSDGKDWASQMVVLIYSKWHTDTAVSSLVDFLKSSDDPPAGIYVLEGSYSALIKRYRFLDSNSELASLLPGPFELVPPTAGKSGIYAIHRVNFMRAKSIIGILDCRYFVNISSRRLTVKSGPIQVEHGWFDDDPHPDDFPALAFMKFAKSKPRRKARYNILVRGREVASACRNSISPLCTVLCFLQVIDEVGCDFSVILAGWHLVKDRHIPLRNVKESMTSRIGFLDAWYIDVLSEWCGEAPEAREDLEGDEEYGEEAAEGSGEDADDDADM